jgi:hypothetical protein
VFPCATLNWQARVARHFDWSKITRRDSSESRHHFAPEFECRFGQREAAKRRPAELLSTSRNECDALFLTVNGMVSGTLLIMFYAAERTIYE